MKFKVFLLIAAFVLYDLPVMAQPDGGRPEYQREYDAYLRDLNVIAQTGKAPKNPELEADLAKMRSNDKILLTHLQQEITDEMILAQSDDARIVDSIEIIRVPEEFRHDYANVYQEEKETISAQSLVESSYAVKKKIMKNDSSLKIAEHINPFRLLKEVELSPLPGSGETHSVSKKDPLVNAYFNQFGRPYVSDSPAASRRR